MDGLERRTLQGLSYVRLDEKRFGRGYYYVSVLRDSGYRVLDVSCLRAPGQPPRRLWVTPAEV